MFDPQVARTVPVKALSEAADRCLHSLGNGSQFLSNYCQPIVAKGGVQLAAGPRIPRAPQCGAAP